MATLATLSEAPQTATKEKSRLGRQRPSRLQVVEVSKTYEGAGGQTVVALERTSFTVPSGGITALLGPSGCGKSSLLRIVAGLSRPTSGHVELDRRRIDGPGRDRGMVFQSYTSFPWLTVLDNVGWPEAGRHAASPPSRAGA